MSIDLALVCVAGGRGARFGGDKLAERVAGRSILEHSLAALRRAYAAAPLVVVVPAHRLEAWRELLAPSFPDAELVGGGARRQDSVRAGVARAVAGGADVVAVHDATRPAVDSEDVKWVVKALGSAAAAVLCGVVEDTVKRVDGRGLVLETIGRGELRLAQTPQVFQTAALAQAWQAVDFSRLWTDEAAMLESLGLPVRSVVAERPNPKLTTVDDLRLIRLLLEARS
jgi:2-C-methyl-D-erythritol 4-phosphate cytidylyltransferase